MKNEFDELQRQWQKDKEDIGSKPKIIDSMLSSVKKKKDSTIRFQFGNIIVLFITMIGISAFFYYVAPVKDLISRIGVGLMIGGLFIRIIIELISIVKSKKIDVGDEVLEATQKTINFYTFRKKIHGPVTIIIIALYTIGFYMITPEFSLYFTTWQMVLIDVSYLVAALIFIPIVRKSIKKEIKTLLEIIELKNKIVKESPK